MILHGQAVVLVDSITQVQADDAGTVVVSGSHGGTTAARYALAVPAALYVFNDAGIGKDGAGVAGLGLLQAEGIAACAVGHESARIGDATDALENGILSVVNPVARDLGVVEGMSVAEAVAALSG